jgi:hypothetical protein
MKIKYSNIIGQSAGYAEGRFALGSKPAPESHRFQSLRIGQQPRRQPESRVEVYVNGKVFSTFASWTKALNWAYRFRRRPNARMIVESVWCQSGDDVRVIKGAGPCRDVMLTHTGVA